MTIKIKNLALLAILGVFLVIGCSPVSGAGDVAVGSAAPNFTGTDSNGKNHSLTDFKGKFVVLEWFNPDCPFVKAQYDPKHMQELQKLFTKKGVIWLSVDSSAPGKQGHLTGDQANAVLKEKGASPTALLLDPEGKIGRLYGAKTTPHMFVIDPSGKLIYAGAIDDKQGKNYVRAALEEAMAGKPVTVAATQSYGCSVKY